MKCQKCGSNEVIFHYSSNINGCVTETHLCSQCAIESGYDIEKMLSQGSQISFEHNQFMDLNDFIESLFPMRGVSGFVPIAFPMMQSNSSMPFTPHPFAGMIEQGNQHSCSCAKPHKVIDNFEIDEEMKHRRELHAQMRAAVDNEEFERAAELRDMIKELERTGLQSAIELSAIEHSTIEHSTIEQSTIEQSIPVQE